MTSTITRWFILLLIFTPLIGCTLPALNMPVAKETQLFGQGLDQYLTSGDLTTLQQLLLQYPHGEWRTRVEGLIDLDLKQQRQQEQQQQKQQQTISEQQTLLEQQKQEIVKLQSNDELAICLKKKEALAQDNLLLEKTLNQLKGVLIDTELQAK